VGTAPALAWRALDVPGGEDLRAHLTRTDAIPVETLWPVVARVVERWLFHLRGNASSVLFTWKADGEELRVTDAIDAVSLLKGIDAWRRAGGGA
jgi:hypothetical protein